MSAKGESFRLSHGCFRDQGDDETTRSAGETERLLARRGSRREEAARTEGCPRRCAEEERALLLPVPADLSKRQ
jgi:hypothetical protein